MGILNSAARTLRRLAGGKVGSLGEKFRDSRLNVGSWGEDIARGFGIQTRKRVPSGLKRIAEGPEGKGVSSAFPRQEIDVLTNKLNTAGYMSQGVPYAAGAGTLGYNMIAGTEPARDAQGVKTGMRDEDAFKVREKYQKEKLGGAKKFTPSLLEMNSKNSEWVKTAIKGIGMERYKQMRRAVMEDPSKAAALHQKLIDQLAAVGDEEMMKQAASEPYVLPGVARVGEGSRRVVVITPTKGKDKETNYTALQYEYEGDDQ